MESKSQVYIITGEPQQGKTTFVTNMVERLKYLDYAVGGFVAPGEFRNHRRHSFKLTDLKTGRSEPLCERVHVEVSHGVPFTFYPDGQQIGKQLLDPENLKDCNIVVIDEIGPLELQGKGWAGSVADLLQNTSVKQIWVVRKSAVQQVIGKFGVEQAVVFDIETTSLEDAIRLVTSS